MKTLLLAGGKSTRMMNAGQLLPKTVILIDDRPIIWHIMRNLAAYSKEFLIALGYHKDTVIDRLRSHALREINTIDSALRLEFRDGDACWSADLVDTGETTSTAGRVKRLSGAVTDTFILAYTDSLSDVDVQGMIELHRQHGRLVSALAVRPAERYGRMTVSDDGRITQFIEKQAASNEWVNGGLFIVEPKVIDYIKDDTDSWEYYVLTKLVAHNELMAWRHEGFWQCMDYPHETIELRALWEQGLAPWKNWDD